MFNKSKYLSIEEQESLRRTLKDTRDDLLIELALATGARASELLLLTKSDINTTDGTLHIKGLKRSYDREMPIEDTLFNKLCTYAQNLDGDKLFSISYKRLFQIWQWYRPCNKKFHSLRHTFAIELYKRSRDIKLVQVALGHKSINTTLVYVDYVFRTEELRRLLIK